VASRTYPNGRWCSRFQEQFDGKEAEKFKRKLKWLVLMISATNSTSAEKRKPGHQKRQLE
jgi:hypothetical protein